jgi:hypothetical protein
MSDQSPARSVPFRPNSLSFGRPSSTPAGERTHTAPVRSLQNAPTSSPRPLTTPRPATPVGTVRKPSPALSPASQQFLQQRIRESLVKIEQMKAKLKVLEDKRQQTLSPVYRQSADLQINALRNQLKTLQQTYSTYRSQERAQHIVPAVGALQKTQPQLTHDPLSALNTLRSITTQLQSHYQEPNHFPDGDGFQLFQTLFAHFIAYHQASESHDLNTFQQLQGAAPQQISSLEPFRFVSGEEKTELSSYQQALITLLREYLTRLQENGQLQPIAPAEDPALKRALDNEEDLEVRFDFKARRMTVQNQMGISLNQPKQTYQEYLDQGFACIDRVVASEFRDMSPFQSAIESFLEAVSLHKDKHEAYFGLGYLYSLVRDVNHALYFLDIAYKISGNPAIAEFMHKVKSSYGVA